MYADAELTQVRLSERNDTRIEPALGGSDTRIDELPQLWNVFRGHMSLVGPARTSDLQATRGANYGYRQNLHPSITGYAQILAATTPMQLTSWAMTSNTLSTGRLYSIFRSFSAPYW